MYYLRRVKVVLSIKDREHSLIEMAEEVFEGLFQVDLTMVIIAFEVLEKVDENVGVPLVNDAVCLLK